MRIAKTIVLITFLSLASFAASAQESCCDKEECKKRANEISLDLTKSIERLGIDPNSYELRDNILDTFKIYHKDTYRSIIKQIKRVSNFAGSYPQGLNCINNFIDSEDVLDWTTHLLLKYDRTKTLSPEFCKGWGLHLDVNSGAADLFRDTESFSSSARLLLAYTFSRKDCGGRVRVMLGPSLYYQDRLLVFLLNPRLEIRLKDIGTDILSIGNLKAIAQANFNKNKLIAGLGVGIELDNFGAQLLGDYQTGGQNYSVQTGLFYRFKL